VSDGQLDSAQVVAPTGRRRRDWVWETGRGLRFSSLSEKLPGRHRHRSRKHSWPVPLRLPQTDAGTQSKRCRAIWRFAGASAVRDFVYELKGGSPVCRWVFDHRLPAVRQRGELPAIGASAATSRRWPVRSTNSGRARARRRRPTRSAQHLADLERTMDAMHMGVVLLDVRSTRSLSTRPIAKLSRIPGGRRDRRAPFSLLMELNRRTASMAISTNSKWQRYLATRIEEIRPAIVGRASLPMPTAER